MHGFDVPRKHDGEHIAAGFGDGARTMSPRRSSNCAW
jgi:hypothetical protein